MCHYLSRRACFSMHSFLYYPNICSCIYSRDPTAFIVLYECILSISYIIHSSLLCSKHAYMNITTMQIPISKPGNHLGLRILAYYLIFFPSLDVMSAYPLVVHCLVNNIYIIVTGRDTSEAGKWKLDWLLRLVLRLVGSITPILAAMGMANLIYVITYGGLSGYIVCYFFPAILQLSSIRACKKKFSAYLSPPAMSSDVYQSDEKTPLSAHQNRRGFCNNKSYMTPYSIPVLSHPLFVAVMTGIVVVIFGLIVASLFVSPTQLSCKDSY